MLKVQKVTEHRAFMVPPCSQRRQKVPSSTLTCTRAPIRLGQPSQWTATPLSSKPLTWQDTTREQRLLTSVNREVARQAGGSQVFKRVCNSGRSWKATWEPPACQRDSSQCCVAKLVPSETSCRHNCRGPKMASTTSWPLGCWSLLVNCFSRATLWIMNQQF